MLDDYRETCFDYVELRRTEKQSSWQRVHTGQEKKKILGAYASEMLISIFIFDYSSSVEGIPLPIIFFLAHLIAQYIRRPPHSLCVLIDLAVFFWCCSFSFEFVGMTIDPHLPRGPIDFFCGCVSCDTKSLVVVRHWSGSHYILMGLA